MVEPATWMIENGRLGPAKVKKKRQRVWCMCVCVTLQRAACVRQLMPYLGFANSRKLRHQFMVTHV